MKFYVEGKYLTTDGKFPTDAKEALKASIQKWKFVARKIKENKKAIWVSGTRTCALCNLYAKDFSVNGCSGCPVFLKTKTKSCVGTPVCDYEKYNMETWEEYYELAQKEVRFLESLEVKDANMVKRTTRSKH
jgi:hypothetical protein